MCYNYDDHNYTGFYPVGEVGGGEASPSKCSASPKKPFAINSILVEYYMKTTKNGQRAQGQKLCA